MCDNGVSHASRRGSALSAGAILAVWLLALLAPEAAARTWTVAQDGSGDFPSLLPAADAIASGDTVARSDFVALSPNRD